MALLQGRDGGRKTGDSRFEKRSHMGDTEATVDSREWKSSKAGSKESILVSKSKAGPKRQNRAKQSHGDQPLYSQWDTLVTTKTKPRHPSSIDSVVYGHFDPVFAQVATDGATLYVADSGREARQTIFDRSEAPDLLKTKDGPRDRTQTRTHFGRVANRRAIPTSEPQRDDGCHLEWGRQGKRF